MVKTPGQSVPGHHFQGAFATTQLPGSPSKALTILSANPTLAISVGAITGIVIGLAAQNIIGNVVAGTILAIMRPVRIGNEITVMGNTGIVIEIGVMHTIVDGGERRVFVPNMAMLTNAVQRKKGSTSS